MTKAEILTRVQQVIVDQLSIEPEEVKSESSFVEDLGADSLDIVELAIQFEEEFDIKIPDEDMEKLVTVEDVAEYISSHQ